MRYIIPLHTGFIAFTLLWLSAVLFHAPYLFIIGLLFLIYQIVKVYYLERKWRERTKDL